jgi:hypothetical protein
MRCGAKKTTPLASACANSAGMPVTSLEKNAAALSSGSGAQESPSRSMQALTAMKSKSRRALSVPGLNQDPEFSGGARSRLNEPAVVSALLIGLRIALIKHRPTAVPIKEPARFTTVSRVGGLRQYCRCSNGKQWEHNTTRMFAHLVRWKARATALI